MAFNLFGPPTKDDIRVGYIDPVLGLVEGVTICQANDYALKNPGTTFVFRNGNNVLQYLNINEVNSLDPNILTSTDECGGINQRRECGPPVIQFFGGGGIGAAGNPVIGKDGSLLAVDIVRGGNGYQYAPLVAARDNCNYGAGATLIAVVGETAETIETYENEADYEDYEICDPSDVGYGRLYGPNGEDIGPWDPRLYTDPGEDPIREQIEEYEELVRTLARKPFWSTRTSRPETIVSSDTTVIPQRYDVTFPAWNEFMNKYAISPTPPSNIRGTDYSGVGFIFSWIEEFPIDGEYVFRGLVDNNARFADLYLDGVRIGDIPRYDDAIRPIQRTITKGPHLISVELTNPPLETTPQTTSQIAQQVVTPPRETTVEYIQEGDQFYVKVDGPQDGLDVVVDFDTQIPSDLLSAPLGIPRYNQISIETEEGIRGNKIYSVYIIFRKEDGPKIIGDSLKSCKFKTGKKYKLIFNSASVRLASSGGSGVVAGSDKTTQTILPGNQSLNISRDYVERRQLNDRIANFVNLSFIFNLNLYVKNAPAAVPTEPRTTATSTPTPVASSQSWFENPMGLALTIDAPAPSPPPQEQPPVQEGRCPNNPIWTTRFPGAKEQWYPVRYTERNLWSKFLNRYAISPVLPLDTPTSDSGGVLFSNSWDVDIPYDGFYKFITEYDDDGRVLLDGNLAFTLQTAERDVWKGLSDRVRSQKVFITKGRHTIQVELENRRTETTTQIKQKIFRTLDWQLPSKKTSLASNIICQAGGGKGGVANGPQNKVGEVIVGNGSKGAPGLAPGKWRAETEASGGGAGLRSGTSSNSSGVTLDGGSSGIDGSKLYSSQSFSSDGKTNIWFNYSSNQNYIGLNGDMKFNMKTGYGYGGHLHPRVSPAAGGTWRGRAMAFPGAVPGGSGAARIKYAGKTQDYTIPGTYEFVVPNDITNIDVICIGGGGSGYYPLFVNNNQIAADSIKNSGGSGGAYAYADGVPVSPGTIIEVVVGPGGSASQGGSQNGGDTYIKIKNSTVIPSNSVSSSASTLTSDSAPGVTYEGPPIIHYQDNRWSPYMNKNSISPLIPGPVSDNGRKRFVWKGVNFPETGQYDVTFLADNNARLLIGGRDVLGAQGFAENPQTFKVNVNQGTYDVVVDSEYPYDSPQTNNSQYFSAENPTGFALDITKNVSITQPGTGQSWQENPMGIGAILIPPPCPRRIRGRGVVTDVIVNDPGNGYLPPAPQLPGYPVSLRLKEVIVENPGINYNCGVDELRITPSNGAELDYVCDPFGKIREVKVLNPGLGFTEYPEIRLISDTGVNASFRPVFEVVRDPIVLPERLIQVTDLVGLKQTGYVDGRPYYGAVYYEDGVRFAGFYETIGEPVRVYDTLLESITAEVTTPPSAIQRQGTDISSNNPRLNLPGTPENLI
jgi:hypothetical protein